MAVLDAEQRKKLEDALMRKAEKLIAQMRRAAEEGTPDSVEQLAQQLAELLKAREFPSQRAAEFRESGRGLQRDSYERSVDSLLFQAEHRARAKDDKGRNDFLTKAKEHFAKALRNGADDEFRAGVERRVQAVLLTTAEGIDERTRLAAARKLAIHDQGPKPPGGVERRRCLRYGDPPLALEIEGVRFTTVNWSIRGVLVDGYMGNPALHPGDRVRVDIHCEGVPGGGRQIGHVVRVNRKDHQLALEFDDISTIVLDLVHRMKDTGLNPEVER